MSIAVWRPVNPELGDVRLAWCERHDVGMAEEIAKADAVLAQAKRQVLGEQMQALTALRHRLQAEQCYCGEAQTVLHDCAKAIGLASDEVAAVVGDADELWRCLQAAKAGI